MGIVNFMFQGEGGIGSAPQVFVRQRDYDMCKYACRSHQVHLFVSSLNSKNEEIYYIPMYFSIL